jgi:beta-glucosidase/6-phospho-beta-glucosidase/beta-galactosidase
MSRIYGATALALALGCRDPAPAGGPSGAPDFGEDFLFGAAIAGFQVDAGCPTMPAEDCEDRGSDWYQWVTDPELVAEGSNYLSGDPLSMGPGHWELYDDDFRRAKEELHLDSMRVSLEWSRLFPDEPVGARSVEDLAAFADPAAVAAYHDYFASMAAHGLTPVVTLNHYTLPLWLHDGKACHDAIETCEARGWADRDRMIDEIARYAGFCAMEFGAEVDWWTTLNEPFAVVLSGYLLPSEDRTNPPGVTQPELAIAVMWAQIEAHAAMYDAVHAYDPQAMVGAVPNLAAVRPEDPDNPADVEAAEHLDYVYNRVFLNATILGEEDRDLDGVAETTNPALTGRMDFVGVNYYTQISARSLGFELIAGYPWLDFFPGGDFWTEHPEGLAEVTLLADSYGLPVLITENGTWDHDAAGERFLVPHLEALTDAIDAGADVRGYHLWSLIDNYEWNHGMGLRFGAYAVDDVTKARTMREIGSTYAEISRTRRLP